jgi:superfamily I DNA/RNA helicase
MKLPKLSDLQRDPSQWLVYEHAIDEPLFVAGPPGSGKTSLAILRAKFIVDQGQTQRVLVVTRNRLLAALAHQLAAQAGAVAKFRTSTMHTLIAKDFHLRFGEYAPQPVRRFCYDWDVVLAKYEESATSAIWDQIMVDEGQNLPPQFFAWASRYGARTLTVFADEHQATCDETSSLRDIKQRGALPDPIRLTRNHRNTPEIARVAEHFHKAKLVAPAVAVRPGADAPPRLIQVDSWEVLASRIANRLRARSESIGAIVEKKADAAALKDLLRAKLDPAHRVHWYTSDTEAGAEAAIMLLDPGITVLTSESAIGLEFDTVYLTDLSRSLPGRSPVDFRRMYMLCARARDALFLVHGLPPLTPEQLAALPDASLLAR